MSQDHPAKSGVPQDTCTVLGPSLFIGNDRYVVHFFTCRIEYIHLQSNQLDIFLIKRLNAEKPRNCRYCPQYIILRL